MSLTRKPALTRKHLGPVMFENTDTGTADRLEAALPYVLDTSKSFAQSLIANQRQYGWSDKQRDWAVRLIEQAREEYRRRHPRQGAAVAKHAAYEPKRMDAAGAALSTEQAAAQLKHMLDGRAAPNLKPAEPRVSNPAMVRILALFKSASEGKAKAPTLRLLVGQRMANLKFSTRDGGLVLFWRDAEMGQGFAGSISPTGVVRVARNAESGEAPAIVAALDAFADPEAAAKAFAKATKSAERPHGNCCFCGLHLTDKRSVSKGYGPICASNWSLPWGE